ncbi:serpin family protein [Prauserella muralis]|uniref:Serine protease n=1 Tax=Prauserella muralis TaxID=588067 RepID=A0A2V4B0I3_9PSEU|nr:serpin family protein [Prauserella muralis]PXY27656.1 serine protease [Prauserella muralis]TWE22608.1 serpin B [Prauserella muralis]
MPASDPETAHLRFALAAHRAVAGHGGDSCLSPYSVASALCLTARAGRGPTADEPATLVAGSPGGVSAQADLLAKAAVLGAAGNAEEPVLAVSNTLWAWDELTLNPGFTAELAGWPTGTVASAPFRTDPDGARSAINADVAETTRELIPELLPPGTIHPDTVACLVNALYLRVAWTSPFAEAETDQAVFHAPSGDRAVPTMHQTTELGHAALPGWQVVSLPAVGGVEAVVLLPDGDLAEQESTLDETRLRELLAARTRTRVELSLPTLSLDVRSGLTTVLQDLGVRTMFTSRADFSPLTPDARLAVSDVLHQTVLRLDESGLEGAAATAVAFRLVAMPLGEPVRVAVDRPFLLLVRHAATGACYFVARVVEP